MGCPSRIAISNPRYRNSSGCGIEWAPASLAQRYSTGILVLLEFFQSWGAPGQASLRPGQGIIVRPLFIAPRLVHDDVERPAGAARVAGHGVMAQPRVSLATERGGVIEEYPAL